MQGFQITFYTQQDHRHHGEPLAEWLVRVAREMGLPGATLVAGIEGFGQHRRLHAAHFFELAEQPLEVEIVAGAEDAERLFARLDAEDVRVFYVRVPVEFGVTGQAAGGATAA